MFTAAGRFDGNFDSRSVVSYKATTKPLFSLDAISRAEKINLYDDVDTDVLRSYQEYNMASLIYYAMKENACSEQSSRMSSMDNATKNAGKHEATLLGQYFAKRSVAVFRGNHSETYAYFQSYSSSRHHSRTYRNYFWCVCIIK